MEHRDVNRRRHIPRLVIAAMASSLMLAVLLAVPMLATEPGSKSLAPQRQGLSSRTIEQLDRYIGHNLAVVNAMPRHPQSPEVFEHISRLVQQDLEITSLDAALYLAEAYRDHPLGLYAFTTYADRQNSSEAVAAECARIAVSYPDSRLSSLALDKLLQTGGNTIEICDQYIQRAPQSKLAGFALMRKADFAAKKGDMDEAIAHYLRAWILDPSKGEILSSRLNGIWLPKKNWIYPTLFDGEYLDDPILNPIKERALARVTAAAPADPSSPESSSQIWNLVEEAGAAVESGALDEAIAKYEAALDREPLRTLPPTHCADLALAAFLKTLPSATDTSLDVSRGVLRNAGLSNMRNRFFALFEQALASLSAPERGYYTLKAARRAIDDVNPSQALRLLEPGWRDNAIPERMREELVLSHAQVLATERHDKLGAGRAIEEFCRLGANRPNENRLRLRAAQYFADAEAYDAALALLEAIDTTKCDPNLVPLVLMSRGLCFLGRGDSSEAIAGLTKVAQEHPKSSMAAHAYYILGNVGLLSQQYDEASANFEMLLAAYPDSEYALRARDVLERLKLLDDETR